MPETIKNKVPLQSTQHGSKFDTRSGSNWRTMITIENSNVKEQTH